MASPRDLRGSRLTLARALLEGAKTASEISDAMGKPTGSFFGVLRRMVADELVAASTGTPTRGTRYSLSRDVRELLLAMDRQAAAIPAVRAQQQLLLVEQPDDMVGAQRVLAQESVSGLIAWAAQTQGGWLLAVEAESTYPLTALMMALQHVGVTSRPLRIDEVFSGVELRRRAVWALQDAGQAAAVDNGSGT